MTATTTIRIDEEMKARIAAAELLYRFVAISDTVFILAARSQLEAGYS